MWDREIRLRPGRPPPVEISCAQHLLLGQKTFQCSEPVALIARPVVRLASAPDLAQHLGNCSGPFRSGEAAGFVKPHSQGERLCLPVFGEHGTVLCWSAVKRARLAGWRKIVLPKVDADRVTKVGCFRAQRGRPIQSQRRYSAKPSSATNHTL
jgi:hypothetical protein